MNKPIYHYNPENGEFLGADMARESPMEPGIFFLPANATFEAPLLCGVSAFPVFNGCSWVIKEAPNIDENRLTLDEIKAGMWRRIQRERDFRTENGGYIVEDKWLHSDQKSRGQQFSLALLGANIPAGLQWKIMDGTFVAMTALLAQQVLAAALASDQAIYAAAEIHKMALEASVDPVSYDFSGGWPKAYGE